MCMLCSSTGHKVSLSMLSSSPPSIPGTQLMQVRKTVHVMYTTINIPNTVSNTVALLPWWQLVQKRLPALLSPDDNCPVIDKVSSGPWRHRELTPVDQQLLHLATSCIKQLWGRRVLMWGRRVWRCVNVRKESANVREESANVRKESVRMC